MKKRLCGLFFTMAVLFCGCGDNSFKTTTAATTSHTTSQPTASICSTTSSTSTILPSETTQAATPTTSSSTSEGSASTWATITSIAQTTATTTTTQPSQKPSQSSTTTQTTTTATHPEATVTFKATIRENVNNQRVANVHVTVYVNGNASPAGSGVTDRNGEARIPMVKGTSYRVILNNLPAGYESNAYYDFSTNTVNITLRKATIRNEKDHSEAHYEEGQTMTNFSLTDIDGDTYQLSSLLSQKQLVVLDFWYTTCEPCKSEFPYFEKAIQKYGDAFALLAINPINDDGAIRTLRQQLNASSNTAVTFPMMRDTCNLALGFEVSAYPTTVFIDPNGIILDIHVGAYVNEAEFFKAIERYLH